MKLTRNIAVALAALAFGAVPALALADGNGHGKSTAPGQTTKTTSSTSSTSSTSNTSSTKAKAYGKACATESKKHVAGTKGTPFSNCVLDMEKLNKHQVSNPHTACANESKKKVAGQKSKGTPYSQCVAAAAKLRSSNP